MLAVLIGGIVGIGSFTVPTANAKENGICRCLYCESKEILK
jgi:hypothetical protein